MKYVLPIALILAGILLGTTAWAGQPRQMPEQLKTATGTLYGTLELPARESSFPVALIVPGSGPIDRDGNEMRLGVHTDCYRLLAAALARNGIASLRYDKRGIAESAQAGQSESKLRLSDYVQDAAAWGRQLRADRRFSTLTIIGHSEGSLIGMLAAHDIHASGFVSIAGAGERAPVLLRRQLKPRLPPDSYAQAKSIIASLEHGKTVAKVPAALQALFRPRVQPYLISWFRYDPRQEISKLAMPVLIVQGKRDLQADVADSRALAKADPAARLVLIPKMNHVLKDVGQSLDDNMAAYKNPKLPIDPVLVGALDKFIHHLNQNEGANHAH
jgi:alpha-beta hydrolase superfamily lysophospholipase